MKRVVLSYHPVKGKPGFIGYFAAASFLMIPFELLVVALPVIFMLHDLEEIIFFRRWLVKNSTIVIAKFPRFEKLISKANAISTPAFTIAVAEEFILLSAISFAAAYTNWYYIWIAAFMAFSLHLFIHIAQCLVLRRYTPGVVTSFLLLPLCVYIFNSLVAEGICSAAAIAVLSVTGIVIMIVNLLLMHSIIGKFKI